MARTVPLAPGGRSSFTVVSDPVDPVDGAGGDDDRTGDGGAAALLWAMRDRMHALRRSGPGDVDYLECRLGEADEAVYVIDDGPQHCMIGRRVGASPDGCTYCLVARISLYRYEQLRDEEVALVDAFSDARDISLSGVFMDGQGPSNTFLVRHYRRVAHVPAEYLPPGPFIEFADTASDE
jgi:hypothetical protein